MEAIGFSEIKFCVYRYWIWYVKKQQFKLSNFISLFVHLLVSSEHGGRRLRNEKWAEVKGWSLEKDTTGMPKVVYGIIENQRV